MQLVEEDARLARRAVLEDALEDSASVRVRSQAMHLSNARIRNERDVLAGNAFESALQNRRVSYDFARRQKRQKVGTHLDNVVTLSVPGALEDVAVKLLH